MQSDRIWNWALNTLRNAGVSPSSSVEVAALFIARAADMLTMARRCVCSLCAAHAAASADNGARSPRPCVTQRNAANLYTTALKPWLVELRLPWASDATQPFSALEHVRWVASQPPERASELPLQVPAVLSSYLAVGRCAALRGDAALHMRTAIFYTHA